MSQESVSILNELIQVTRDSEEGFRTAVNNVDEDSLKQVFTKKAERCSNAVAELQKKVSEFKGEYEEGGTLLGAMHRGWVNIKGSLTGKDSHAILSECERGEDVIKAAYAKALESNLSESIRPMIQSQYESVVKEHDLIRDLRDQYAAKAKNQNL